jgi:hypothetical protein
MIDQAQVDAKVLELNGNNPSGPWIVAGGVHAITALNIPSEGTFEFQPNTGLPVKVFIHRNTGEFKIFDARIFGLRY